MKTSLKSVTHRKVNQLLHIVGIEVVRYQHHWDDPRSYIPFRETLHWAKLAGMTVGDYIDKTYNVSGATQETIDQMAALGVFTEQVHHVCEIGPGSGRYLEKTLAICHPSLYEIYETATDWAQWLPRQYPVILQPTDGVSLRATPTASVDLTQAHKVFPSTPFLVTCRYLLEMMRVTRKGGKIVFDVLTEKCLDDVTLTKWLNAGIAPSSYPNLLPEQYIFDFLERRGFTLVGSFFIPCAPGKTECMVFTH